MKKKTNNLFLIIICTLCISLKANAQIELPTTFTQKLEQHHIHIALPLENKFKTVKIDSSKYMPYDFAIKSRKEKLEMRYYIHPFEVNDSTMNDIPQVQSMLLLTNIAKNEEDAITAVHRINQSELKETYQADWGIVAYFQPKTTFSHFTDCKMVALFKEGQATAYIFYLFDGYNDALDQYAFTLTFQ